MGSPGRTRERNHCLWGREQGAELVTAVSWSGKRGMSRQNDWDSVVEMQSGEEGRHEGHTAAERRQERK